VLLWRLTEPEEEEGPGKTWTEVVDKDMNDLHLKLSDAME